MDCKIIFCHLRFSFLEVKWLLKVFSSTLRMKTSKISFDARIKTQSVYFLGAVTNVYNVLIIERKMNIKIYKNLACLISSF